jgi:hypothetical protein
MLFSCEHFMQQASNLFNGGFRVGEASRFASISGRSKAGRFAYISVFADTPTRRYLIRFMVRCPLRIARRPPADAVWEDVAEQR